MKFFCTIIVFVVFSFSLHAQSYVLEVSPKGFFFMNGIDPGVGGDISFAVSKVFTLGACGYFQLDDTDLAAGLNMKFTSNRQRVVTGYGTIKVLYGMFETTEYYTDDQGFPRYRYIDSDGIGGAIGAGLSLRLIRSISLYVELNHFINLDGKLEGADENQSSGFRGVAAEAGFVFKMFRKK